MAPCLLLGFRIVEGEEGAGHGGRLWRQVEPRVKRRDVGIGAGEEEKEEWGRRDHSRGGVGLIFVSVPARKSKQGVERLGFKNVTTHPVGWMDV